MGKKITENEQPETETHKKTKANRFDDPAEPQTDDKHTWPSVPTQSSRKQSSTSDTSPTASKKINSRPTFRSTEKFWQSN